MYKNPTELLLEPFREKKEKFFEVIRSYIDIVGLLGDKLIEELKDLPPSLAYVVECLQSDEPLKLLDAVYKIDENELDSLTIEQAKAFKSIPNQMQARYKSGYDTVNFLVSNDWENASDLEYKKLQFILDPLSKDSLKSFKYKFRAKIKLLNSLPTNSEVINYATNSQYGNFILALRKGDKKGFLESYRLIRPVKIEKKL